MSQFFKRLGLKYNPFEPSASGAPVGGRMWLPQEWYNKLQERFNLLNRGKGVKALAITGEYGSGKTYILQWLYREEFPNRLKIKPYYFDNPGVQFYDLANSLLRQIGRKEFAKSIWEIASIHITGYQRSLFSRGFEEYLNAQRLGRNKDYSLSELQKAIKTAEITGDDEIAHRLSRIVSETLIKPYFEYQDFITGKRNTLVAECEEAPYFKAILKTLRLSMNIQAVAFLIDEFEEVSLQKRLTRREAHDYLATLKRLINLTQEEDFWLVLTMTPKAAETTRMLEPSLWDRFASEGLYQFEIPPLEARDALNLVINRLNEARIEELKNENPLFPFDEGFITILSPATISNARRLVKVCFYAISNADGKTLPFKKEYLQEIENKAYPESNGEKE